MNREIKREIPSAYLMMIVLLLVAQLSPGYLVVSAFHAGSITTFILALLTSIVVLISWGGFMMVPPEKNAQPVLNIGSLYT